MNTDDIHASLAKGVLHGLQREDDALALMILLHTHLIRFKEPILDDRPGIMELAAITQRHAAEVLAAIWPRRTDPQRTDYTYWYYQFNARTPFEVVEDIPPEWLVRVQRLREVIGNSPMVESLEPED